MTTVFKKGLSPVCCKSPYFRDCSCRKLCVKSACFVFSVVGDCTKRQGQFGVGHRQWFKRALQCPAGRLHKDAYVLVMDHPHTCCVVFFYDDDESGERAAVRLGSCGPRLLRQPLPQPGGRKGEFLYAVYSVSFCAFCVIFACCDFSLVVCIL